jgi:hypothetical protein
VRSVSVVYSLEPIGIKIENVHYLNNRSMKTIAEFLHNSTD